MRIKRDHMGNEQLLPAYNMQYRENPYRAVNFSRDEEGKIS